MLIQSMERKRPDVDASCPLRSARGPVPYHSAIQNPQSDISHFRIPTSDFPLNSQVGFSDLVIGHQVFGRIRKGHPAGLHDIAPVGDFKGQVGILFHQKNGGFTLGVYSNSENPVLWARFSLLE